MTALERKMEAGDEALLRTLIGQVSALATKVEAIAGSLDERVSERRQHADGLEHRLVALESRVRAIELTGAEGKTMPESVRDHERRLRTLESMRWQLLAIAFLGSGAGWIVTNFVIKL